MDEPSRRSNSLVSKLRKWRHRGIMTSSWPQSSHTRQPTLEAMSVAGLPLNDNMKPDNPQKGQRKGKEVTQQAKSLIVTVVIKTRQEKQDIKNKILTSNVYGKTPWGGVLTSWASFLRNKEALQETAVVENLQVPRSVRSTVLDEDVFSVQLRKSPKSLQPISPAITAVHFCQTFLTKWARSNQLFWRI